MQLIGGYLGVKSQSALVIVFSIISIVFVIPLSFGYTISALVGQAIGAGQVAKGKQILWVTFVTWLMSMTLVILFINYFGRDYISEFVENEDIIERAYRNIQIYAIVYVVDGSQ